MTAYVELESDHRMSAFLAGLTPSRVLREREALFSMSERQRKRFFVRRQEIENNTNPKGNTQ